MSTVADPIQNTEVALREFEDCAPSVGTLIKLYERNRSAFFHLAVAGVGVGAEPWKLQLAHLAAQMRELAGSTFKVADQESPERCKIYTQTVSVDIDNSDKEVVLEFLRQLGGSVEATGRVRDFTGTEVSDSEIQFKLGTVEQRSKVRERLQMAVDRVPKLLRIDDQDLEAIQHGMPGYVIYELLNCATRVVQVPTAVFQGTRLGGRLTSATAYCGKPRKAFGNDGIAVPAPTGMVYCVYADPDGYVFDWDWVEEDTGRPGCPIHHERRFGGDASVGAEAVLALSPIVPSAFRKSKAWHSQKGDCMFFYASDAHAYAVRTNDDLTVYRAFEGGALVGCKVKNFAEILSTLAVGTSAVPVGAILTASLVRQLEDHQRREREQFLKVIAQLALEMGDAQRTRFLTDVLLMDAEADDYLETIRGLALRYTTIKQNAVANFADEYHVVRREIEKRYLKLITAAGSSKITAARAA